MRGVYPVMLLYLLPVVQQWLEYANNKLHICSINSPSLSLCLSVSLSLQVLSGLSSDNLCLDLSLFTFDAVKVFLRFLYTATLPVNTDSTATTGPLTDDVKHQLLTLAEM